MNIRFRRPDDAHKDCPWKAESGEVSAGNFAVAMLDGSYEVSDVFSPTNMVEKRAAQFCFAVP